MGSRGVEWGQEVSWVKGVEDDAMGSAINAATGFAILYPSALN